MTKKIEQVSFPAFGKELTNKLNEIIEAVNSLAEKYGDTLDSRMEQDQKYWHITDSGIADATWYSDSFDKKRWAFGNVFTSKEAAEEAAKRVKELLKSLQ